MAHSAPTQFRLPHMIHKNSIPITSLAEWKALGGPKRASQWLPERSAFEVAREWLDVESPQLPRAVHEFLKSNAAFSEVNSWNAEPEAQIRIDDFRGEPRNCDLLVKANDSFGDFVIAVEAKADEPFDVTVEDALSSALERLVSNPKSKGVERITNIARMLFGAHSKGESKITELRYQLLTATAGALAAAKDCGRGIMLVQEFRTGKTSVDKHEANSNDLNRFVRRLSRGTIERCEPGILYGPIPIFAQSHAADSVSGPHLFVGKVVHDRTTITADEAVRTALRALGGEQSVESVSNWIEANLTQRWKDLGTTMADMTPSPESNTGYPRARQILLRAAPGVYYMAHRPHDATGEH